MILLFLGLVLAFVCIFAWIDYYYYYMHEEGEITFSLIVTFLMLLCFILVLAVNKGEETTYISRIPIYSTFNTTEMNVHGGLLYTTTDNKDYLIYWTDEGAFKKRNKMEIFWYKNRGV